MIKNPHLLSWMPLYLGRHAMKLTTLFELAPSGF